MADSQRWPVLDSVKGILILTVVAGHTAGIMMGDFGAPRLAYWFIYLFHMPAFALASGMATTDRQRSVRTAVRSLLPIYLGYSLLHVVMRKVIVTDSWSFELLVSPGLHWYLLSLLCWRLLLPWVMRFRYPLSTTVMFSLLAGLFDNLDSTLSISRTIVFLPFFVAGHKWGISGFKRLREVAWWWIPPAVVAVAGFAVAFFTVESFSTRMLAGSRSYTDAGDPWASLAVRVAMLLTTACAVFVLVRVAPAGWSWLQGWGRNSIGIYLLHLYPVYLLERNLDFVHSSAIAAIVVVIFALLVTALLGSPPIVWLVHRFNTGCVAAYDLARRSSADRE